MDARIEQLLEQALEHERAGGIAQAFQAAQQALELARAGDDREGICGGLAQVGWLAFRQGRLSEATTLANQALEFRGKDRATTIALAILGICAAQSDLARAEEFLRSCADLSREIGMARSLAMALHNLAYLVYFQRGQFNLALETMRPVAEMADQVGFPIWGYALLQAQVNLIMGRRNKTRAALAELESYSTRGWTAQAGCQIFAAGLALDEGDLARADEMLRMAREILQPIGHPQMLAWTYGTLSRLYRLRNDVPTARAWADEGLAVTRRANYRLMEAELLLARAQAHWAGDDLTGAGSDLLAAIEILKHFGAAYDLANASFLLAALYSRQQRPEAESAWLDAARQITSGGYEFILERERTLAFPLISAYARSSDRQLRGETERLLQHLGNVPPLPLHVTGLGRFRVTQGAATIPDRAWEQRKAGELFRLLLLQPGHTAPRDQIFEALWPGRSPDSAERFFHQATHTLRHVLEPDLPPRFPSRYLQLEAEWVTLLLPSGSTVDFVEHEQKVRSALGARDRDRLRQVLDASAGDLLPLDRYADWSATHRERLAQTEVDALLVLAGLDLAAGEPRPALDACRRVLQRESWHEEATLIGMRACLALNDRPQAFLLYRSLENALQQDLGIAPRADLAELATQILSSSQ